MFDNGRFRLSAKRLKASFNKLIKDQHIYHYLIIIVNQNEKTNIPVTSSAIISGLQLCFESGVDTQ
jgi:hypothetical protein